MKQLPCLLIALFWCAHGIADTLVMKNGDRLTGRLDTITAAQVIFETRYAGRIWVDIGQILSLETDEAYSVRSGSNVSEGFFSLVQGEQQLLNREGRQPLVLQSVRSATQPRNRFTRFSADWGLRLDLALSLADGNSSTEASNFLLEADYQDELNAHVLTALLAREEGEGALTKDQLDVDYGYKRFVSERWFGAAHAEYFQDTLKEIDSRITVGAGVGVQFIDSSLQNLATDLGVSAVREDIGGDSNVRPAVRIGLDYQQFFFAKTVELFHRQSILQLADDDNGQVISSSTGVRYAFSERVDTNFRIDVAYESDPAPGNEKTDTTYSLGVGLKF